MAITRVYTDTNILVQGGWPRTQPSLTSMLSLAARANVDAFVPELVMLELEAKWLRDFEDKKRQVEARIRTLADHTSAFNAPALTIPTLDAARDQYKQAAAATLTQLNLALCPTTARGLHDLLSMAAFHEPPFPDRDSSFRDAVILLSVADHLDEGDQTEALFISDDDFFKNARLKRFRTTRGSTIHMHPDTNAATKALVPLWAGTMAAEWAADQQEALRILREDRPNVEQFIRENLDVPVGFGILFFGPRVLEVRSISLESIDSVALPLPLERPNAVDVAVSFDATVSIGQVVELSRNSPSPQTLKLGQALEQFARPFTPPTREETIVRANVTVQATGHIEAGAYQGFTYTSVGMAKADRKGQ